MSVYVTTNYNANNDYVKCMRLPTVLLYSMKIMRFDITVFVVLFNIIFDVINLFLLLVTIDHSMILAL
jgi:hypothetical protein